EQAEDLVQRAPGREHLLGQVADRLHGRKEAVEIKIKGGDGAQRDAAVKIEPAADQEDHHVAQMNAEAVPEAIEGIQQIALDVQVQMQVATVAKFLGLQVFGREGAHHADAPDLFRH